MKSRNDKVINYSWTILTLKGAWWVTAENINDVLSWWTVSYLREIAVAVSNMNSGTVVFGTLVMFFPWAHLHTLDMTDVSNKGEKLIISRSVSMTVMSSSLAIYFLWIPVLPTTSSGSSRIIRLLSWILNFVTFTRFLNEYHSIICVT